VLCGRERKLESKITQKQIKQHKFIMSSGKMKEGIASKPDITRFVMSSASFKNNQVGKSNNTALTQQQIFSALGWREGSIAGPQSGAASRSETKNQ
jgi:hypothetical protein